MSRADNLTTLMVTHNMKNAIQYGNRLIMMDAGKVIVDIRGEEKKNLTVRDLLEKFNIENDRMLLERITAAAGFRKKGACLGALFPI